MNKLEYVNCILCDSDDFKVLHQSTIMEDKDILRPEHLACTNLGHGRHHRIVRCNNCGLIYANPRDYTEQISDSYEKVEDEEYCVASGARVKTFNHILKHLEKYKSPSRLLDIGCYTGLFMNIARSRGWNVFGIEPSQWAAKIAKDKYNLSVLGGSVYDLNDMAEEFDTITMWDVIEHVPDPLEALQVCRRRLRKSGILAISTMRCEGLFYKVCGSHWPWFMRMHLYYFTNHTLVKMLNQAGYRIVGIHNHTRYTSLDYLLYKMAQINNIFLSLSKISILRSMILPINFGDLIEVYATRKD